MQYLYIVRHGETDANVENKINDKNIITTLNKKGELQSKKTGQYLKKNFCKSPKHGIIFSSPSTRAVQTAEIIANELKLNRSEIIYDDRINEIDYGLLSGVTDGDRIYKEYMHEFNKLSKDPILLELEFPKFDKFISKKFKTETILSIKKRLKSFYSSLSQLKKNIIIITHGGIIQGTIMTLFNIKPQVKGDLNNGKNCTINCITKIKNKYELITLPNTLHLK